MKMKIIIWIKKNDKNYSNGIQSSNSSLNFFDCKLKKDSNNFSKRSNASSISSSVSELSSLQKFSNSHHLNENYKLRSVSADRQKYSFLTPPITPSNLNNLRRQSSMSFGEIPSNYSNSIRAPSTGSNFNKRGRSRIRQLSHKDSTVASDHSDTDFEIHEPPEEETKNTVQYTNSARNSLKSGILNINFVRDFFHNSSMSSMTSFDKETTTNKKSNKSRQAPPLNFFTTMPKNFSKFVARVGPIAEGEKSIKSILAWEKPTSKYLY